ncbi:hypothetical protein IVA93_34490 [Bradyrhizobium sp. 155]|uniref:hypothetical protein n=1 Tax=Bradyrhizobium sp. 155 TaxID=2782629 RepID=UPI001FFE85C2|nr:hypothetical protein [Bradyrhizobium sp. 155]UPK11212.1 hypothetical protein IVA93_34490 [Bradyrhizobium sp. 155]
MTDLKISPRLLARDDSLAGTSASRLIERRRTFDPRRRRRRLRRGRLLGRHRRRDRRQRPVDTDNTGGAGSQPRQLLDRHRRGGKGIVIIRYTGPTLL